MSPCMSHGFKCLHTYHTAVNVSMHVAWQSISLCMSHGSKCLQTNFHDINFQNMSVCAVKQIFQLATFITQTFKTKQSHNLGSSRLPQHVHIVNITSVRLLIAPFGRVAAFTTCPHCQYYQYSSLNRILWAHYDFHNMSTLSILPILVS